MSATPTDDELLETLRKYSEYGPIPALAAVAGLHERTLYRYVEKPGERSMRQKTRRGLTAAFLEVGLTPGADAPTVLAAVAEIERLATTTAADPDQLRVPRPGERAAAEALARERKRGGDSRPRKAGGSDGNGSGP